MTVVNMDIFRRDSFYAKRLRCNNADVCYWCLSKYREEVKELLKSNGYICRLSVGNFDDRHYIRKEIYSKSGGQALIFFNHGLEFNISLYRSWSKNMRCASGFITQIETKEDLSSFIKTGKAIITPIIEHNVLVLCEDVEKEKNAYIDRCLTRNLQAWNTHTHGVLFNDTARVVISEGVHVEFAKYNHDLFRGRRWDAIIGECKNETFIEMALEHSDFKNIKTIEDLLRFVKCQKMGKHSQQLF